MHDKKISVRNLKMLVGWTGLLTVSLFAIQSCFKKEQVANPLFKALDTLSTHLNFINSLEDRIGQLSVVDYLYYYNGAGVACGDVDNDGLTDIFFVSNHGKNKLYKNKGNFQFDDISKDAGVEGLSDWKTGVTMADINADGYLDIYICSVGDYMGLEGSNELYINNGDNTFSEKAADYGLDHTGFSTQAAFFDYDRDGDLDMYLVTHAKFNARAVNRIVAENLQPHEGLNYLFRNDNGKFADVSESAGIRNAQRGYGLGITITDFNNDGWDDIYVTNDFYEGDFYWINNQDGTFSESLKKYFGHVSLFSHGCDAADMNNDGYQDVMTVDVSPQNDIVERLSFNADAWDAYRYKLSFGHHDQVSRNCLQINRNGLQFSDVALLSGVSATNYSWSMLLADFNNDGDKDIFITNGASRRLNDLDYIDFASKDSMRYAPQLSMRQVDEAIHHMPVEKTKNFFYQAEGELVFEARSIAGGINEETVANGASYADLDNDGDLDLVTNNMNELARVYENQSNKISKGNYLRVQLKSSDDKNTFGIGAKIYIKTREGYQMQQLQTTRGFLSSVEPIAHFGIGTNQIIDSLIVVWTDGKSQVINDPEINRTVILNRNDASNQSINLSLYKKQTPWFVDASADTLITYHHKENEYAEYYREKLIPFLISTEGPKFAVGDVNQDGREDFYVGGAKYQPGSLFIQNEMGGFTISHQPDFRNDSIYEDVDAALFDADNDGDLDLYVVTGGNEFYGKMIEQFDRLYRNDGRGSFKRDRNALPEMFDNKSCVRPFDFDKDGDLDLFVGGRVVGYHYGKSPRSYLLVNDGKGNFSDLTSKYCPDLLNIGMITDAIWADTDHDGDVDLLVAGDWMPPTIFENTGTSWKRNQNIIDAESSIKKMNGFWQCLLADDFDSDGDVDFMAGNLGLNTKFMKQGEESMLVLYHGDFDGDRKNDPIPSYRNKEGLFFPVATRDEFVAQFSSLKDKFKTNAEYADKTVEELFNLFKTQPSNPLMVDQFASLYFENNGNNKFKARQLPWEVQTSKIFSMYKEDFNKDGRVDVLLGGNYRGGSVYQGNYDASNGSLLQGDGKGSFSTVPFSLSGLNLQGEVRDVKAVKTKTGIMNLISKNNGAIQILKAK